MALLFETATPTKTLMKVSEKGKYVTQEIVHINKKGTFKKREQCNTCKYLGKVQIGLNYGMHISCDREEGTWKECRGSSKRQCKFYQVKE